MRLAGGAGGRDAGESGVGAWGRPGAGFQSMRGRGGERRLGRSDHGGSSGVLGGRGLGYCGGSRELQRPVAVARGYYGCLPAGEVLWLHRSLPSF